MRAYFIDTPEVFSFPIRINPFHYSDVLILVQERTIAKMGGLEQRCSFLGSLPAIHKCALPSGAALLFSSKYH